MKIKLISLLMMFVLAGCVTETTSFLDGSGRVAHITQCQGSFGACYRDAGKVCGARGYEAIDRVSTEASIGGYAGCTAYTSSGCVSRMYIPPTNIVRNEFIYRCKE